MKDYVFAARQRQREMFVPLTHPAGHAQADFGEADAVIAGVEYRAHYFVMTLPHSDFCFVCAYPAATTEAWLDGHNRAFNFFGGADSDEAGHAFQSEAGRYSELMPARYSDAKPAT